MRPIRAALFAASTLIATSVLASWYVHFLGSDGKVPTCFGAPHLWPCVQQKMCEKGHLWASACIGFHTPLTPQPSSN